MLSPEKKFSFGTFLFYTEKRQEKAGLRLWKTDLEQSLDNQRQEDTSVQLPAGMGWG